MKSMKTVIAICFILVATVTSAQNTINLKDSTLTVSEKRQEGSSLKLLVKSLKQIGEEDILFHKDSLKHYKSNVSTTYKIKDTTDNFKRVLRRFKDSTHQPEVSYHIHIKDTITLENFKDLQIPEFESLKENLRSFVTTLQESSKLKELAAALKKLKHSSDLKN
ncbi:hypothetical protein JM84_0910 [Dokdonia sp. Hel_I_63]|jgi:hypothetical protein|uniref:hypothetical protein n=1 Tax=unclassified Dokdonia TaxID=2615033 RepID=UPI00020A7890|nr:MULTISPECIES: hypothetical protein [unclassified Dokdonia]AEE18744.1 hypothetical protein Krodi_0760 [Dokdonia sp. 4H-3-7-5]TVZ22028.1 hypothetical protein JM84_0910 [Dokdonia sp. Hel_I_63]